MNEPTLNALINLFAIFTIRGGSDFDDARQSLEDYLANQLGIRSTEVYVDSFLEVYNLHASGSVPLDDEGFRKITGTVCQQVKGLIHHSEQLLIFLHFLALSDPKMRTADQEILDQVCGIFEILPRDYGAFMKFITASAPADIDEDGFLILDGEPVPGLKRALHIRKESFGGTMLFYRIIETGQILFRYFGNEQLKLEGNPVRPQRFYLLNPGGIIRGNADLAVYYTEVFAAFYRLGANPPLRFTAHNVSFTFPRTTNGIHPFWFSEPSGQLIAVMGASGVGKSTLLTVLSGNLPVKTGSLTINGADIHREFDRIEGLIGYIPQDDLAFEELTVYQNLYFNALLCLDQLTEEEVTHRVDHLLDNLGLMDVRDMVVGHPLRKVLSGGQRKRLNIALELIREPAILFVDEPTSGLSSRDSEKIMILLKQLAQQGKLVIANIHQPSSFVYKLFDKLWVFDQGGYPVYAGNPLDGIAYFRRLDQHIDAENCECSACGNVRPDEVFDIIEALRFDDSGRMTATRKYEPEDLYRIYLENIQRNVDRAEDSALPVPKANFHKPSRLGQFRIFFVRNFHSKATHAQYIILNLLQPPLLALVVGLLTRYAPPEGYTFGANKNFPSFIFMSVIVMLFQGMSLSAEEIIRDRKIVQRETFLRLSRFSYLNAKILLLAGISLIQTFLFLLVATLILQMEGLFLQYWLILFLTAVMANLTGLNISSGLNSVVTIYITIPLLIIPQILLSGLIVRFEDMPGAGSRRNVVPLIGDLMVSRWSFEALAVEQFMKNRYTIHFYPIDREISDDFIKGELLVPEIQNIINQYRFARDSSPGVKPDPLPLMAAIAAMKDLDEDRLLPAFASYDELGPSVFTREAFSQAVSRLDTLRKKYKTLYNHAEHQRDRITARLTAELGPEGLTRLKNRNQNTALSNLLTDRNADRAVVVSGSRLLVKVAPIYRVPGQSVGRAHFYAPVKAFGPWLIDTYYFNSVIILLMILFLYVALYFDWLRRLLAGSQSFMGA